MPRKVVLGFRACLACGGLIILSLLTAWFSQPVNLRAQGAAGAINGTVRDPSGAAIPKATIDLINVETNIKRTTQTNDIGNYVLVDILPGKYNLEVTKEGFGRGRVSDIIVLVNQTATYDITLNIGQSVQEVNVQAAAATVETSTAELGTAVATREVNDLPLNGRNFTQLLALTPGVSPANVSQSTGWMENPIGDFVIPSVNGQNNRSNFFLLDGLNNQNDYASSYAVAPIVDGIEEFKVQSHNDEAQYGEALGGIVNVVTKSGTNQVHGSAWEFVRNSSLDARNPFVAKVGAFEQNQFGATVGGPVVLPHYNGRNKTFFFGSYQGFRDHVASQNNYRVPTAAELSGDLSDFDSQIYNPYSTTADPTTGALTRQPFMCDGSGNAMPATNNIQATGTPCNKIPQNMLDPGMLAYAKALYPEPVQTSVAGLNGINSNKNITRMDEYNVRIDESLGTANNLWFRYSGFRSPVVTQSGVVGNVEDQTTQGKNWGASWLHTFGPSGTMQLGFGHNQVGLVQNVNVPRVSTSSLINTVGFASNMACGYTYGPTKCFIPGISISGFAGITETYFESPASDVWETKGDWSFIHGKHTLKAGFDIQKSGFTSPLGEGAVDNYSSIAFSSFQTSDLVTSSGGVALASYLLGVPNNGTFRGTLTTEHGGWIDGFYFQDQFKATSRLTVNIGVRYDVTFRPIQGRLKDGNLYIGDLDLSTGNYILQAQPPSCESAGEAPCIPGGTLPDHVIVTPFKNHAIFHNTYDNIQPRIGLAYKIDDKTSVRASFGKFFDNWAALTQSAQNFSGTWPSVTQRLASNLNSGLPTVTAEDPFKLGSSNELPSATPFDQVEWYLDPKTQNAYSEQWNLGIERQLTNNTLLTANYVGSHSSRLDLGPYENVARTPGPGDPQLRAPYPYIASTYYDQSIGKSDYNGFQFSLRRSFSSGLAYLVSYTWSKSMDIGCSGWFGVEGCSIENPYDLEANRSVSGFDLTHILSFSPVYQIPFGVGKKYSTKNRFVDQILGNWQVNGILTVTSGLPYDVGASGDIANTGMSGCCTYGYERLNLVGNPKPSNQSPSNWLNVNAFATPAQYTFGNLGRNALRADTFKNLDLSLFRQIPFTESKKLEIRFEAFNLTNTPTWGIPDQTQSDPLFGQVTSTRSTARQVQIAAKFYF